MLLLQNYSKELNFKFPRRENCNAIILKQTKLHFSYSLAVWKLWNPVSGRQPPFHLHIFKPAIPSPCTSHLASVKKESAVSMLLRNSLGLLNKYFPIVAGCLIRYSSCISRSVTERHFLTQNELIVSGLVTRVGEHTAQSNKPQHNCCQGRTYDRGSEDEPSQVMVLLPPPALCHPQWLQPHSTPGSSHWRGTSRRFSRRSLLLWRPGGRKSTQHLRDTKLMIFKSNMAGLSWQLSNECSYFL